MRDKENQTAITKKKLYQAWWLDTITISEISIRPLAWQFWGKTRAFCYLLDFSKLGKQKSKLTQSLISVPNYT